MTFFTRCFRELLHALGDDRFRPPALLRRSCPSICLLRLLIGKTIRRVGLPFSVEIAEWGLRGARVGLA